MCVIWDREIGVFSHARRLMMQYYRCNIGAPERTHRNYNKIILYYNINSSHVYFCVVSVCVSLLQHYRMYDKMFLGAQSFYLNRLFFMDCFYCTIIIED